MRSRLHALRWPTAGRSCWAAVAVVVVGAIGTFLRIWALGRQPVNADEAIVGLMAHQIVHGHFSAFYWGQNYGGAEPYVVAIVFALFGQSAFSLGLTPVLLAAVAAVLTWRIGRRIFSPAVGLAAGLVVWVWPEVFLWQSTLEYGFRFVVLDAGLGGVLVTLNYLDAPAAGRRLRLSALLGLLFGLGWWASPEIVYFAIPVAVVLAVEVVRRRTIVALRDLASAITTLVLGALPWIVANLASGGASLRSGPQPDPSFTSHLETLRLHVLPIALGLAVPVSGRFIVPHEIGRALEYGAVVIGVAVLVTLVRRRQGLIVVVMAVLFPLAYAASPFTWYWQDGRYAIYLVPTAALIGVAAVDLVAERWIRWRHRIGGERARQWALTGLVLVVVVITLDGARLSGPFRPGSALGASATWTSWHADATGYAAALARGLTAAGIHNVIAGYWVAEPLTFASGGSVTASDLRYDRQPGVLAEIERNDTPTYLFVRPARLARATAVVGSSLIDPGCAVATDRCLTPTLLRSYLTAHGVGARSTVVGDFIAITPDRPVAPGKVFAAFGIPT